MTKNLAMLSPEKYVFAYDSNADAIFVRRGYVHVCGGWNEAIMLARLIWWSKPTPSGKTRLRIKHEGRLWVAKNRSDWWEEAILTVWQVDHAIKNLVKRELIEVKLFPFYRVPTHHFIVNFKILAPLLAAVEAVPEPDLVMVEGVITTGAVAKKLDNQ